MYLFHVLRSFLPLNNPIGFGASDFIFFTLTLLLVLLVLARAWVAPAAQALARRAGWSMLIVGALVVALRLALLPVHPVPLPTGADDFSFLLLGDTLAHFRLAEPDPSAAPVLRNHLRHTAAQLQLDLSPGAGLGAGVGTDCFWPALGGRSALDGAHVRALLLDAARLDDARVGAGRRTAGGVPVRPAQFLDEHLLGRRPFGRCRLPGVRRPAAPARAVRKRHALLLGLGLGIQMLSRPFESLFLGLSAAFFFLPELRRPKEWPQLARCAALALAVLLPAGDLILLHNHAVTGSWTTLPYSLSRYQYGVPTTFTFQPNPVPHATLTPEQWLYAEGQAAVHGPGDSPAAYFARLASRAGFYRFFFLPPLILALPFFLPLLRQYRYQWIAITILMFALGTNFYPYFSPQYVAALTSLFLLTALLGLERLSRLAAPAGPFAARFLVMFCAAHFLFWFTVHAMGDERILRAMAPYETADSINSGDPEGRIAVNGRLAREPGPAARLRALFFHPRLPRMDSQ